MLSDEEMWCIATHEAGHAIASLCCDLSAEVAVYRRMRHGAVAVTRPPRSSRGRIVSIRDRAFMLLAGYAAEMSFIHGVAINEDLILDEFHSFDMDEWRELSDTGQSGHASDFFELAEMLQQLPESAARFAVDIAAGDAAMIASHPRMRGAIERVANLLVENYRRGVYRTGYREIRAAAALYGRP